MNTPNVPVPEDAAEKMRKLTRPCGPIPDDRRPRCYKQCVEGGSGGDNDKVSKGYEQEYMD